MAKRQRERSRDGQVASTVGETTTSASRDLRDWAAKGTVGGLVTLALALGTQQASTILDRQRLARLLLPEVEYNVEVSQNLLRVVEEQPLRPPMEQWFNETGRQESSVLDDVKFERRVYDTVLTELRVLPPHIVQGLYRAYSDAIALELIAKFAQRAEQILAGEEFGPEAAAEFRHLPQAAQRMLIFQAQLNKSDGVQAPLDRDRVNSLKEIWNPAIRKLRDRLTNWQAAAMSLREQAAARWWLNWLE